MNQLSDTEKNTAYAEFIARYPDYANTQSIDILRQQEYARLDRQNQVYLDYTGGGLYADAQVERHLAMLKNHVFGNPHSSNPSSKEMTRLVESARQKVLSFFNANPDEYEAVFTPNASGALKMVGEAFPFGPGTTYLLTFDNHNSVNGIREFARVKGADVYYAPVLLPDLTLDETILKARLDAVPANGGLFAYPAQSNFSGIQHDLKWISYAQEHGWQVILDAAAFVPSNRLDLSLVKPEFIPLSFYKMFGYPTGVGCLIAKKEALKKLHRPWFAGGTITVASVQGDTYYMAEGAEGFEDGTLNYLSLPAVQIGLEWLESVDVEIVHRRVRILTSWLLEKLHGLKHPNGSHLIKIYGPLSPEGRGGTITMNFYDQAGRFFDHRLIERAANRWNMSLRTGCFCNPGGGEVALEISQNELVTCFAKPEPRITFEDFRLCMDGKSSGAVRVSFGLASNFTDAYVFTCFARQFVDRSVMDFS